jgi:hypothetical protein
LVSFVWSIGCDHQDWQERKGRPGDPLDASKGSLLYIAGPMRGYSRFNFAAFYAVEFDRPCDGELHRVYVLSEQS